jgi:tellurite resistance protein TehA-like permease
VISIPKLILNIYYSTNINPPFPILKKVSFHKLDWISFILIALYQLQTILFRAAVKSTLNNPVLLQVAGVTGINGPV